MIDSFICRYGNQSIETVRGLSEYDRSMFFMALEQHLKAEYATPDSPSTPTAQTA